MNLAAQLDLILSKNRGFMDKLNSYEVNVMSVQPGNHRNVRLIGLVLVRRIDSRQHKAELNKDRGSRLAGSYQSRVVLFSFVEGVQGV